MKIWILWFISFTAVWAQPSYFPPSSGAWETTDPQSLGFCQDSIDALYDYLEDTDTKAFLMLEDGKIVLEQYFDDFSPEDNWYWASAGKTLTAFLVGLAQEQGHLNVQEPTSTYLGGGWTQMSTEREDSIRIIHQLTMTSGLNDDSNLDCTDPECLTYLADPGTRWSYHNAPYTLLAEVVESATQMPYNRYTRNQIYERIGMQGIWLPNGYNRVHWSTPRSMARFGLLVAHQGVWDGDTLMHDQTYFKDMIQPSQELNESYGYLWWLNGQASFMLPQSQIVFNGSLVPSAPEDAIFALGKNAQILTVIPSQNRVIVRMGNAPGEDLIAIQYGRALFQKIEQLECSSTSVNAIMDASGWEVFPNPVEDRLNWDSRYDIQEVEIYDLRGIRISKNTLHPLQNYLSIAHLPQGWYIVHGKSNADSFVSKVYKN